MPTQAWAWHQPFQHAQASSLLPGRLRGLGRGRLSRRGGFGFCGSGRGGPGLARETRQGKVVKRVIAMLLIAGPVAEMIMAGMRGFRFAGPLLLLFDELRG